MSVVVSLLSESLVIAVQVYWPLSKYCADSRKISLEPSTKESLKMESIHVAFILVAGKNCGTKQRHDCYAEYNSLSSGIETSCLAYDDADSARTRVPGQGTVEKSRILKGHSDVISCQR